MWISSCHPAGSCVCGSGLRLSPEIGVFVTTLDQRRKAKDVRVRRGLALRSTIALGVGCLAGALVLPSYCRKVLQHSNNQVRQRSRPQTGDAHFMSMGIGVSRVVLIAARYSREERRIGLRGVASWHGLFLRVYVFAGRRLTRSGTFSPNPFEVASVPAQTLSKRCNDADASCSEHGRRASGRKTRLQARRGESHGSREERARKNGCSASTSLPSESATSGVGG